MKEVLGIISTLLYVSVGLICLVMALKNFGSARKLPFNSKAAGVALNDLDSPLQKVIIAVFRVSGLGFLVVFILLTLFPIVNYFRHDRFLTFAVPAIAMVYSFGLFIFNYNLYRQTKAKTPWIGSLAAFFIIGISLLLSAF